MDNLKYILIFLLAQLELVIPATCMDHAIGKSVIRDSSTSTLKISNNIPIINIRNDGMEVESGSINLRNPLSKSTSALTKSSPVLEKYVRTATGNNLRNNYGNNLMHSNSEIVIQPHVKSTLMKNSYVSKTNLESDRAQRNTIVNDVESESERAETIDIDDATPIVAANLANNDVIEKGEDDREMDVAKFNDLYQSLPDHIKTAVGERDFGYILADVNVIEAWKARETLILTLCAPGERICWGFLRGVKKIATVGGWVAKMGVTVFPMITMAFPGTWPRIISDGITVGLGIGNIIITATEKQLENSIKEEGRNLLWKKMHTILPMDQALIAGLQKNK